MRFFKNIKLNSFYSYFFARICKWQKNDISQNYLETKFADLSEIPMIQYIFFARISSNAVLCFEKDLLSQFSISLKFQHIFVVHVNKYLKYVFNISMSSKYLP